MQAVAEAMPIVGAGAPVSRMINGKYDGKYDIYDPAGVKYVERTDFLKGICGHIDHAETLEDIMQMSQKYENNYNDLRSMAQMYSQWKNKGARLPKFSRWVTGMFAGNAAYAKILADEGQKAAARKIIMSVDVVDILRCADTPHFNSCFDKKQNYRYGDEDYSKIPVRIVEETPGIGIIYVDDENGFMLGRHWMHHAKIKDTGEDMVVLTQSRYGCLEGGNVARLLAERGIKVGLDNYNRTGTAIEYVGCFTKALHHDLETWRPNPKVDIINP